MQRARGKEKGNCILKKAAAFFTKETDQNNTGLLTDISRSTASDSMQKSQMKNGVQILPIFLWKMEASSQKRDAAQ